MDTYKVDYQDIEGEHCTLYVEALNAESAQVYTEEQKSTYKVEWVQVVVPDDVPMRTPIFTAKF